MVSNHILSVATKTLLLPFCIVNCKICEKYGWFINTNLFLNNCLSEHLILMSLHVANGDKVGHHCFKWKQFAMKWRKHCVFIVQRVNGSQRTNSLHYLVVTLVWMRGHSFMTSHNLWHPSPLSRLLLLRLKHCCHKVIAPLYPPSPTNLDIINRWHGRYFKTKLTNQQQ